jgi:hypothetical protein
LKKFWKCRFKSEQSVKQFFSAKMGSNYPKLKMLRVANVNKKSKQWPQKRA